jgi:hypothetical protein
MTAAVSTAMSTIPSALPTGSARVTSALAVIAGMPTTVSDRLVTAAADWPVTTTSDGDLPIAEREKRKHCNYRLHR